MIIILRVNLHEERLLHINSCVFWFLQSNWLWGRKIMKDRVNIIDVQISNTNLKDLIEEIMIFIEKKETNYICVSNVHTTVEARKDKNFRKIVNESFMSIPDGMPLTWIGKLKGHKSMSRTTGPDVMDEIFKLSQQKGYKHYFYGSSNETISLMIQNLKKEYPDLIIVGSKESVFRSLTNQEDQDLVTEINRLNPDIIWVGLGAPRQEIWMNKHRTKIESSLMIGVGGAFAIYAGLVSRAPHSMQRMGIEWLYRLIKEPRRLWKRYLVSNLQFLFYLVLHIFIKEKKINY